MRRCKKETTIINGEWRKEQIVWTIFTWNKSHRHSNAFDTFGDNALNGNHMVLFSPFFVPLRFYHKTFFHVYLRHPFSKCSTDSLNRIFYFMAVHSVLFYHFIDFPSKLKWWCLNVDIPFGWREFNNRINETHNLKKHSCNNIMDIKSMAHENYNHCLISNPPHLIQSEWRKKNYKINMSHGNGFYHFNYCTALLNELVFPSRFSVFFPAPLEWSVCACLSLRWLFIFIIAPQQTPCEWIVNHFRMVAYVYLIALVLAKCVALPLNDKHQKINAVLTKEKKKTEP